MYDLSLSVSYPGACENILLGRVLWVGGVHGDTAIHIRRDY